MQEVEAVCDRVIIIKKGEILVDKKLEELQDSKQQIIEVTFNTLFDEVIFQKLSNLSSVKNTSDNNWQLTFSSEKDMRSKIFDLAQEHNLKILGLTTQNKNLETFFREVTI
jgi:ABC-2 type transport system ATP-binding protein